MYKVRHIYVHIIEGENLYRNINYKCIILDKISVISRELISIFLESCCTESVCTEIKSELRYFVQKRERYQNFLEYWCIELFCTKI